MPEIDPLQGRESVGLVAENSIGFVREAFAILQSDRVLSLIRSPDDTERGKIARITDTISASAGTGWFDGEAPNVSSSDAVAQILFTSGTTGSAKGVAISHGALETTSSRLVAEMGMNDEIREYIGVPVFLSFGLGRCRAVARCGGRFFVPSDGFDVQEIERLLRRGEINAVSAVPSLWRLLLSASDRFRRIGARMRWIEIGSQAMATSEKMRLRDLFPNATIIQHYGLTEASRSTFLPVHSVSADLLDSVGKPVSGSDVRIGTSGRIELRGPQLAEYIYSEGYWSRLADKNGWLSTADSGHLDGDGWLYFDGRMDDLINCGGTKLSPELVEQSIRESLGKQIEIGVARIPDKIRGDGILVATRISSEVSDAELREVANQVVSGMGVDAGLAIRCRRFDALPVTDGGKLRRRELGELYARTESSQSSQMPADRAVPRDSTERFLAACFSELLDETNIGPDTEFFQYGVDSLAAVELVTRIYTEYGVELTLVDLLESQQLSDVARKVRDIQDGSVRRAGNCLVSLSHDSMNTSTPIVIVGGAYGNVVHLRDLAGHMAKTANVYGLQYPGLSEGDDPIESIPRIAARFIDELTEVPNAAGFHLVGYSAGGIIAAEMSRQLAQQGKDVPFLAMIDTRLPNRDPYHDRFGYFERCAIRMIRMLRNRRRLAERSRARVSDIFGRSLTRGQSPVEPLSPARLRSIDIHEAFHRGLSEYKIPSFPKTLHYYRPAHERQYRIGRRKVDFVEDEPHRTDSNCNGWDRYFERTRSTTVPGDHYSLVIPPNAATLADALSSDIKSLVDVRV